MKRIVNMKVLNKHLWTSALVMKLIGWGTIVGGPVAFLAYAPGFFWGELPPGFPMLGPAHPRHRIMALTHTYTWSWHFTWLGQSC